MAKFNGYVVTEAGRNLIAKGLTGDTVIFTKMQLGDGTTSNDGRTMTALVSTKADLPIIGLSNTGTGIAELRFLINNKDITTGFYIKEVGVFAKGADGVEVLYAYNVSPNPDFIPPFSANNIIEIEYVDSIIVDQVANITASIDPSITYMTQAQISSTYVKKTDIATQTEVNNGLEDTKIVTSKKLKARLDSLLAGITSTYVKLTQLATETTTGISKIATQTEVDEGSDDSKIVTPKKLKALYIPFSKGYKSSNNVDWVLRANTEETWLPHQAHMYNTTGNYVGSFHTNGGRAFYKVPTRNEGNWCEIMDNFDMVARDNRMNVIDGRFNWSNVYNSNNFIASGGSITAVPANWNEILIYYRVGSDNMRGTITFVKGGHVFVHNSGGLHIELRGTVIYTVGSNSGTVMQVWVRV